MTPHAAVILALLAGATLSTAQYKDYNINNMDILRFLIEKPWIDLGPHNRWDRGPRIDTELGNIYPRIIRESNEYVRPRNYDNEDLRSSDKRSAVATALNAGRRRRQPTPALGKAVTPYVGVGVLNDVGSFFDSLRDNLETLASLSPQQRSNLFQEPPTVVQASSSDLTTADRTWRRTGAIQGRTTTIQGYCGLDLAGRHQGPSNTPHKTAVACSPDNKLDSFPQYLPDLDREFVYDLSRCIVRTYCGNRKILNNNRIIIRNSIRPPIITSYTN